MDHSSERYVPATGWAGIAYEHLARYLFAQPLAAGKQVLDVGCGEGYGSHILSKLAAAVVGVDLSAEAVTGATARYAVQAANLRYVQASATRLPLASHSIDLAVAFEMLEHIAEHDEMLAEVRRVLRPGGVFLVSTPNKVAYSDLQDYQNPFHVKELYFDEFRALAESRFRAVRFFAQKNLTGSLIATLDEAQAAPLRTARIRRRDDGNEFEATAPASVDHMYYIAACSDSVEAIGALAGVVVADRDERILRESADNADRLLAEGQRKHVVAARELATVSDAVLSSTSLASVLLTQVRRATEQSGEPPPEQSVYDLIIPNFNAPDILKRCIDSLIENTDHRHRIHVVDDASTDPRVDAMMRGYIGRHAHIHYYRLPANLGFPGAVNAGLASTTYDVVLVNSDTEFPPAWLARMDRCRRSDPGIHAVSPLSNNATICSVPAINEKNLLPPGMSVAAMDQLVRQTSLRRYPRAPTLVGFCMLMTRRAIADVGTLDMAFGRGYGEEVDWCQRAWALGYQSVICDDVYVYHHGEVGFSQVPERQLLRQANEQRVAERWPDYGPAVQAYCMRNPLRFQQHKLVEQLRRKTEADVRVLHVTHSFDQLAGTELFIRQLVDGMRDRVASTVLFPANMSPYHDCLVEEEGRGLLRGGLLKVRMNANLNTAGQSLRGVAISLRSNDAERFFADVVAASGADVVQFNHLGNVGSLALPIIARAMGAKVIVVLHDYFLLCPDWNLLHRSGRPCGEAKAAADSARCVDCLGPRIQSTTVLSASGVSELIQDRAALARAILELADVLIAPSVFVRDQFTRAWGKAIGERIRVVPHGTVHYPFEAAYTPREELRVAFLGNANYQKGVDTFADAARQLRGSSIRFRILGGVPTGTPITTRDNLELTGPYLQRELPRLLQDVDVVSIGSIWNETYCYTVDEAFRAGAPVIASAVGAIPERVDEGRTGFLIPPSDVPALVSAIRRLDGDRALLAAMRRNVAALRLRSIDESAAEYAGLYAELAAARRQSAASSAVIGPAAGTHAGAPVSLADFAVATGLALKLPLVPEGARPAPSAPNRVKRR